MAVAQAVLGGLQVGLSGQESLARTPPSSDRQSQILLSTTTFRAIMPAHNIHSHRHNLGEEGKEMLGKGWKWYVI